MAANFTTNMLMPARGRRGGGMGLLSPVASALQARGTPGGMFLGGLLQALAGQQGAAADEEARKLQLKHLQQIVNAGAAEEPNLPANAANRAKALEQQVQSGALNIGEAEAGKQYWSSNAATKNQQGITNLDASKLHLSEAQLKIGEAEAGKQYWSSNAATKNQQGITNLDASKLHLSEAQRQAEETKKALQEQQAVDAAGGAFKRRVASLIEKGGLDGTSAIQRALSEGLTPPAAEGAAPIPVSESFKAGGAPTVDDQAALENNRGLLKRWGIGPDNTEKLETAAKLKRAGDILGEEKQTTDFVGKLTDRNIKQMRVLLALPDETPIGPEGSAGEPAIEADPSGAVNVTIGGQKRTVTPQVAKEFWTLFSETQWANQVITDAKIKKKRVHMGLLEPLHNPERVAAALVQYQPTKPANPGAEQDQSQMEGYDANRNNLMGLPAAGTMKLRMPTGTVTGPQVFSSGAAPAPAAGTGQLVQPSPLAAQLGQLTEAEAQAVQSLKARGLSKDQIGAELLRQRNANTR